MTEEMLARLEHMWRDGVSLAEIATALGYEKQYVGSIVSKDRKRFPYRHRQVPRRTREKWVTWIMAGRATKAEAARRLGVKYQTVDRWVREERGKEDGCD